MKPPPRPLTGVVFDARTGEPISSAQVAATSARELVSRGEGRRQASFCATAANGGFVLHLERSGVFLLAVHAPGYLPALLPVSQRATRVRVALERGADLVGVARDRAGAPREGATVRALCASPLDAVEARTDWRGRFAARGLRPGRWLVCIDGEATSAEVVLREGGVADVVLAP